MKSRHGCRLNSLGPDFRSNGGRIRILPLALLSFICFWAIPGSGATQAAEPDRNAILDALEGLRPVKAAENPGKVMEELLKNQKHAAALGDYLLSAAISNLMGEIYEGQGSYQRALQQYEQGMEALANRSAGAVSLIDKALMELRGAEKSYVPSGGPPVSVDLYRGEMDRIQELFQKPPEKIADQIAVVSAMNAANLYLRQHQYAQANALYQKALEMARSSDLILRRRQIYANMAWAAIVERRFGPAETLLQSALEKERGGTHPVELRRALLALGVHARESGNLEKAVVNFKKAIPLYQEANDLPGRSNALAHLATAYLQQDKLGEARTLYQEALKLDQKPNPALGCHAHGGLAKTYYRLGQWEEAVEHYSRFADCVERLSEAWFTDQGKVGVLEDSRAFFLEYAHVTLQLGQKTGDFTRARNVTERGRARALEALMQARMTRAPLESGSLPSCLSSCVPEHLLSRRGGAPSDSPVQAAPGVMSQPQISPGAMSLPQDPGPLKKIPRVDAPAVTFLETYVLPDRTAVLVKHPDGKVEGSVADIGAETLRKMINSFRQALEADAPRGVKIVSGLPQSVPSSGADLPKHEDIPKQLYELLIRPVEKFLPRSSRQPVAIIPHDSLWFLPFAALRDEDGEYFGDQHLLTYAISEGAWKSVATRGRTADHRKVSAWVAGNPDMPPTVRGCGSTYALDPLPGAEEEAKSIAGILGAGRAQLFTRSRADRLRLDAWHQDFSVLHFATHGVACPSDPLSSFMVLKELKPDDLDLDRQSKSLSLKADPRLPVKLVDPLIPETKPLSEAAPPARLPAPSGPAAPSGPPVFPGPPPGVMAPPPSVAPVFPGPPPPAPGPPPSGPAAPSEPPVFPGPPPGSMPLPPSAAPVLPGPTGLPIRPGDRPPFFPGPLDLSYPGLLEARTIINQFSLDADLVTLSACQTGMGQLTGEGMIGFTRAFLAAGSRSLLVSLWRVDDQSTKELMVRFYREYLEHGNKGLALQRAMAETRKRYPHPKYWAAFTLVGMAE